MGHARQYTRRASAVSVQLDFCHDSLDRGNALGFGVGEHGLAIHQHVELMVGVLHLRRDAVFALQLVLKAPGQASQTTSKQASADENVHDD